MGVSGYAQVCSGVGGSAQVCAGVHGYARVCASVWDEFSEFLLENRVPTSADFNTYPIRIFSLYIVYFWAVFLKKNVPQNVILKTRIHLLQ